ncbi:MAG TPA: hypothetical protein PK629_01580 [Oscillospiraceae bacterium]|nr:hypothetical protein [Oscillospiraceae bacterium]HPF55239.1 hypothetical protein [Clostridiales bacterium]HPK35271.1 hypothetical protein [Oscillospiraceae bacterium]HPR75464.1 hypothetical protein [Oscillospiraceae bacterium]
MFKTLLSTRLSMLFSIMFGRLNRGKQPTKTRKVLIVALAVYVVGMLLFSFGSMFAPMAQSLPQIGFAWLYFAMVGLMGFAFGFIGSIFMTEKLLFESTDNDMLLAMPIPPSYILGSRLLTLVILEYIYSAMIFIPAGVVYAMYASTSTAGWIFYALTYLVFAPFITALTSFCGWVIALINSKVARKNIVSTVFMLLFFLGFMAVYMNLNAYLSGVITNSSSLANSWQNGFPPIYWLGTACADGNVVNFLLLAAFCIIPFVIAYLLLSANFFKIATARKSAAKIKYVKKELKAQSARKALTAKEIKRFFTLPIYFLNAGFGAIMLIAAAVFIAVKGADYVSMMSAEIPMEGAVCAIVCLVIGFCNLTIAPAASAISLEGKNINLLKSLPMAAKDIFAAKLTPNLVIGLIPSFLCSAVAAIFLPMTGLEIAAVFAFPLAAQTFIAFLGLFCNIKLPRFDWTNETLVVKQSGAVMIVTLGGMAMLGVLALVYALALAQIMAVSVYLLIVSAVLLAVSAALEGVIAKNAEKYMLEFSYN